MNKTVYLDNSATTQVFPEVADYMAHLMKDVYGNPSSMHFVGLDAEQELKKAKKIFCDILHAKENEIYFTAGGTESNNMSIIGAARAKCRAGRHIITTAIEHPSVLNTMQYLEDEGYEVTYLQPDSEGMITPDQVKNALRDDTIIVSTMMVNNEIGSRLPVEEIGKMLKEIAPKVVYHVDCVQGFGKYRIRPERAGIDLLSVSGHKIHGPKGIGLLYVRSGVKILPIIFGGGQQAGLRSGTENIPGIAGMAMAADMIYRNFDEEISRLTSLKERLRKGLSDISDIYFNGPKVGGAPHIVSASFKGVRSEVLLHALEEKGVCVSAGSACSTNHPGLSDTLVAIKINPELLESTLRFSLGHFNTEEDVDICVAATKEVLEKLRKYTRR